MIRLMWTKSNKPLSKLIRWIFNEPCSHFAIVFDDRFLFQSNLKGAHPTFFNWFLSENEIVHELVFRTPVYIEEAIWDKITSRFNKPKPYDYGAFFYLGIRGLGHKWFGFPLPTKNLWGDRDYYMCLELAQCLDLIIRVPANLDALTPQQLWLTTKPLNWCVEVSTRGTHDDTNSST